MEFIQCSHCGKKYGINEKVRNFVGQEIKCKACHEKFPIIIHIRPDTIDEPEQQAAQGNQQSNYEPQSKPEEPISEKIAAPPASNEAIESEDDDEEDQEPTRSSDTNTSETKPRGNKIQLYMTIFLVICLLAGLSFLLFINNTKPVPVQAPQTIIEDLTPQITNKEIMATKTEVTQGFSDECKKVAAGQWLIDHNMIHGQLSNDQYMDFMDLSQEQSSKVREICGNDTVVQQVLQAARDQVKPAWFRDEIKILQE